MVKMDPPAHRPMTIPNPPLQIPIASEIQHNGGPSKQPRIVHSMDTSHSLSEDSPGPLGSAYSYHHPSSVPSSYRGPPHYPPYFPVSSPPQPFIPGTALDYHPRSHYRSMNYPPPRSIPPYHHPHPDPQHYMRLSAHQYLHHQQQRGYPPMMYSHPPTQPPSQYPSDIFAAILDENTRQHSGPGFAPMDWPVHGPVQDGRPEPGTHYFHSNI